MRTNCKLGECVSEQLSSSCSRSSRPHAAAPRRPIAREHAEGQVLKVQDDKKEAIIRHEEIPGFMSAMTMPYNVLIRKGIRTSAPATSSPPH